MATAYASPGGKTEGPGGSSKSESINVGTLTISVAECAKDVQDEVIAAAQRAIRAQHKGELRTFHEVAAAIRRDCVAKTGGVWHVIVGSSFGSYVTHESGNLMYFSLGPVIVCVAERQPGLIWVYHTFVDDMCRLAFKHG